MVQRMNLKRELNTIFTTYSLRANGPNQSKEIHSLARSVKCHKTEIKQLLCTNVQNLKNYINGDILKKSHVMPIQ